MSDSSFDNNNNNNNKKTTTFEESCKIQERLDAEIDKSYKNISKIDNLQVSPSPFVQEFRGEEVKKLKLLLQIKHGYDAKPDISNKVYVL
jgi:hypothetical protein